MRALLLEVLLEVLLKVLLEGLLLFDLSRRRRCLRCKSVSAPSRLTARPFEPRLDRLWEFAPRSTHREH